MRRGPFKQFLTSLVLAFGPAQTSFTMAQPMQPVSILTHPVDQTVVVGRRATLSVVATGTALAYQWFANGTRLAGATSSSYTTPTATLAMNAWTYHVVVSNALGPVTSEAATLTVIPDTTGPLVAYAVVTGPAQIEIQFDEQLLREPGTNFANYSVFVLGTTNRIAVTNTAYAVTRIRLRVNQDLNPLTNYVVCMANLADSYTNRITPNPTCIGVGFPETNQVVSLGALWRYNDNATNTLPPAWKTLDYDDDPFAPPYHWADGYAAFGYSLSIPPCSPLQTALSPGVTTYYFRKRFVLADDYPSDSIMRLRHEVDDGAVFYINGAEIYRTTNMPAGPLNHFTLAGHVSTAACVTVGLTLPPNVLVRGTNLLAVEVHQATEPQPDLVDVVFDAELALEFRRPPILPELRVAYSEAEMVLTWEGDGWSLEVSESVGGPWSRLPTSNNHYVRPWNESGGRTFFRLASP